MDFEDQEDHDEEMELGGASYDSLGNSGRVKMQNSGGVLAASGGGGSGGAEAVTQPSRKPRYRECLKNHAVGLGGHALDGCGEFMPAGAEGTLDGLKCAACNCHRNFHRKEGEGHGGISTSPASAAAMASGDAYMVPHHHQFSQYYRTPAGYLVATQQRPLALPSTSGGGGGNSRDEQDDVSNPSGGSGGYVGTASKKRFRTKFTQEQKERMMELAERLGWRIQKHDEQVVQQFCNDTGVKRHVLKVWMHNNKHTLGKKP